MEKNKVSNEDNIKKKKIKDINVYNMNICDLIYFNGQENISNVKNDNNILIAGNSMLLFIETQIDKNGKILGVVSFNNSASGSNITASPSHSYNFVHSKNNKTLTNITTPIGNNPVTNIQNSPVLYMAQYLFFDRLQYIYEGDKSKYYIGYGVRDFDLNYDGKNTGGVIKCDFRNNCSFGNESFFYPTITRNIDFSNNFVYYNSNFGFGTSVDCYKDVTLSCVYSSIMEQTNGWINSKGSGLFGTKTLSGCTGSICYKKEINKCKLVNSLILQSSNNGLIQNYGFGNSYTTNALNDIRTITQSAEGEIQSVGNKDLYFYNLICGLQKTCDYELSCSYSGGIHNNIKKWTIDCNKYINYKKKYKIGLCAGTPVIKKGDTMKIFEFYCCTDIFGFRVPFFIDYVKNYNNNTKEADICCCGIRPYAINKINLKSEEIEECIEA